jgi:hypothetical protein
LPRSRSVGSDMKNLCRAPAALGEFIRLKRSRPAKILLFEHVALTLPLSINDFIVGSADFAGEFMACPTQLLTTSVRSVPTR